MTLPSPSLSRYREEALKEVRAERAPINIKIAERVREALEKTQVMSK